MKSPLTMISSLLCLTAITVVSPFAHAGEKAGNGGKVVICPYSVASSKREVLDYNRSLHEFGLAPLEKIDGADEYEMAAALIERIRPFNPSRADAYLADLAKFRAESEFLPNSDFPSSDDTSEVAYCQSGRIVQVITQRIPLTSFEKRYLVNEDEWKELPIFQRAILLTHEIALKEALSVGYRTADGAARMNAVLFSRDLGKLSRAQLAELYLATGLLYIPFSTNENKSGEPLSLGGNVARIQAAVASGKDIHCDIPALSLDLFPKNLAATATFPIFGKVAMYDPEDRAFGHPYAESYAKAVELRGFLEFSYLTGGTYGNRVISFEVRDSSFQYE